MWGRDVGVFLKILKIKDKTFTKAKNSLDFVIFKHMRGCGHDSCARVDCGLWETKQIIRKPW